MIYIAPESTNESGNITVPESIRGHLRKKYICVIYWQHPTSVKTVSNEHV